MNLLSLKDKLVAVLGFGREGRAVLSYLQRHGIRPTVFDERSLEQFEPGDREFLKSSGLNFIFGPESLKELTGFNIAFRSPGIHRLHPDILEAEKKGVVITSQTKWFFEFSPAPIIGVTGTKGKGTASSLIYEMLSLAIRNGDFNSEIKYTAAYLTGNIGKTAPFDILDTLKPTDVIIFELSSFQLQDLGQSPHIGVVLMVVSDHLDSHKSLQEYVGAKEAVVKYQKAGDIAVINADVEASKNIGALGNGKKLYFSRMGEVENGAYVEGERVIVATPEFSQTFDASGKLLRGRHNLENISAAILASLYAGVGEASIQSVIRTFKGLEHRLEFVADRDGVVFINDSISTTQDTTIAAIESFNEPLVIILGGSEKHLPFDLLAKKIAQSANIKHLIIVGETTDRIVKELSRAGVSVAFSTGARDMEEIFEQISATAERGDVVLLSPACASFGMFKNYADRGNQFKSLALVWQKRK